MHGPTNHPMNSFPTAFNARWIGRALRSKAGTAPPAAGKRQARVMAGPLQDDTPPGQHRSAVPVPSWLVTACRAFAALGGLVLVAVMLMTVASILRRALIGAPIPGDFELVEIGSAIIIACFLPWCQVTGGNVLVDVFTMKAGARTTHALGSMGDLVYLVLAGLLTWRMILGASEFARYGEQSMVLRIPIWWGFLIIVPAMALLIVTILFTLVGHLRRMRR